MTNGFTPRATRVVPGHPCGQRSPLADAEPDAQEGSPNRPSPVRAAIIAAAAASPTSTPPSSALPSGNLGGSLVRAPSCSARSGTNRGARVRGRRRGSVLRVRRLGGRRDEIGLVVARDGVHRVVHRAMHHRQVQYGHRRGLPLRADQLVVRHAVPHERLVVDDCPLRPERCSWQAGTATTVTAVPTTRQRMLRFGFRVFIDRSPLSASPRGLYGASNSTGSARRALG